MTQGLLRLRRWAKIVKQVLAQWQALLERYRASRLSRAVGSAPPFDRDSNAHNDNAVPALRALPESLLEELSSAHDWQSRARAAEHLTSVVADGVVPGLVRALSDPSVEVALAAMEALSRRRDPRVDAALLEVVRSTDGYYSPVTRACAVGVLAKRLSRSELAPIFDAVRDVDADVSVTAIRAVAEHAPVEASPILLPLLMDRSGYYLPIVRLAATKALRDAGALTPDVAGQLLESEPDSVVRQVLEDARGAVLSARFELEQSG
jgi:HEAT repeat protein